MSGVTPPEHGGDFMRSEALASAVCVDDVEELARANLPHAVWDFIAGGSGREETLRANRQALERVRVVPRVLRGASSCTTEARFFGSPVSMPVAIAPVAYHTMVHPDGERATARAARDHAIPLTVSTFSSQSIESVVEVGGSVWFQLYWLRDERTTLDLVRRAEDAGCEALMLTVDVPWMGRRSRDLRNHFAIPHGVGAANLPPELQPSADPPRSTASTVADDTANMVRPSLTWSDVEKLRAYSRLPLILKGILDPDDAARAIECGADGLVVSNHGGRQLDGAVTSIDALEAVTTVVNHRCLVLLDSGIRSGTDVLRALALGADGVLVGRPVIWGLAAAGGGGVKHVLDILGAELLDALGLSGCATVGEARELRTLTSAT